jgi:hypothetical protein
MRSETAILMKTSPWLLSGFATMALSIAPPVLAQTFEGLVFNQPVQGTDATHSQLGNYYTGTTFDFLNVVPSAETPIDMRVTILDVTAGNYSFRGTLPDYSGVAGEPGGDLGFLYTYTGGSGSTGNFGEGGVTYQLDFYSGGGSFTTRQAISNFSLMVYDIDGEPSQGESVMAFADDGLMSYQLFDSSALEVTSGLDGSHRFSGPLALYDQEDPATSVVLNYANTSSVRLRMIANTNSMSPNNNGVFGGIDGDLSLIGADAFGSPIMVVPEPSTALLALLGLVPLLRRRR